MSPIDIPEFMHPIKTKDEDYTHMICGIPCTKNEFEVLDKLEFPPYPNERMAVQGALDALRTGSEFMYDPATGKSISLPVKEPQVADSVAATLAQRGSRYGDFTDHARICQDLKDVMVNAKKCMPDITTQKELHYESSWAKLSPVQKQALEVIADKIARILSGDPNYDDNWHDIQGYAKLVEDRLPCNVTKETPNV